jgi:hypothetical protein
MVRGRPDRRPIAVSKSTGLLVRDTRPPVARMTQRWSGEIRLPINHVPARVAPILLSTRRLARQHDRRTYPTRPEGKSSLCASGIQTVMIAPNRPCCARRPGPPPAAASRPKFLEPPYVLNGREQPQGIEACGNPECRSGKPPSCEYRCRGESMRPRLVAEVSAMTTTPAL